MDTSSAHFTCMVHRLFGTLNMCAKPSEANSGAARCHQSALLRPDSRLNRLLVVAAPAEAQKQKSGNGGDGRNY